MIQMVNVGYRLGKNTIISGVNLRVNAGDFVCVVGPSGAGKSTLLRLIHMQIFPTQGSIRVADYDAHRIHPREIPYVRRKVGIVFQDFKLLEDRDVYDNVAFALYASGVKRRHIKKRILKILAEVGLSHRRYAMTLELSGGEQQRVAIARALVNEPFVLLADEPTGNLDAESTRDVLGLLKRINTKGTAILMATHKEDLVRELPVHIIRLRHGKVIE